MHERRELREQLLLQHGAGAVRAGGGERGGVCRDRGPVCERKLRDRGLLRERDLRKVCLRSEQRDLPDDLRDRHELCERLLLQHDDALLRPGHPHRHELRGDRGAVRQRKLRGRGLLRERELRGLRLHRRELPDGVQRGQWLRVGELLQHGDPPVRQEHRKRSDVRRDSGAVRERKLRGRGLLHECKLRGLRLHRRDVPR